MFGPPLKKILMQKQTKNKKTIKIAPNPKFFLDPLKKKNIWEKFFFTLLGFFSSLQWLYYQYRPRDFVSPMHTQDFFKILIKKFHTKKYNSKYKRLLGKSALENDV